MAVMQFSFCRKRNTKALLRLRRMQAFNEILQALAGHRGGKTFMVDTSQLKCDPPRIVVIERLSPVKLRWAMQVSVLVSYHRRTLEIELHDNTLTYLIY